MLLGAGSITCSPCRSLFQASLPRIYSKIPITRALHNDIQGISTIHILCKSRLPQGYPVSLPSSCTHSTPPCFCYPPIAIAVLPRLASCVIIIAISSYRHFDAFTSLSWADFFLVFLTCCEIDVTSIKKTASTIFPADMTIVETGSGPIRPGSEPVRNAWLSLSTAASDATKTSILVLQFRRWPPLVPSSILNELDN